MSNSKIGPQKLPPVEQMPAKKLAAEREMLMIARCGANKIFTIDSRRGLKLKAE